VIADVPQEALGLTGIISLSVCAFVIIIVTVTTALTWGKTMRSRSANGNVPTPMLLVIVSEAHDIKKWYSHGGTLGSGINGNYNFCICGE